MSSKFFNDFDYQLKFRTRWMEQRRGVLFAFVLAMSDTHIIPLLKPLSDIGWNIKSTRYARVIILLKSLNHQSTDGSSVSTEALFFVFSPKLIALILLTDTWFFCRRQHLTNKVSPGRDRLLTNNLLEQNLINTWPTHAQLLTNKTSCHLWPTGDQH